MILVSYIPFLNLVQISLYILIWSVALCLSLVMLIIVPSMVFAYDTQKATPALKILQDGLNKSKT